MGVRVEQEERRAGDGVGVESAVVVRDCESTAQEGRQEPDPGRQHMKQSAEKAFPSLEASGSSRSDESAQDRPEIGGSGVDLIALGDVLSSTQVKPSHGAGLAEVSEASLDGLAASAQEPSADRALESATVLVEGPLPPTRLVKADLASQPLPSASSLRSALRDAVIRPWP